MHETITEFYKSYPDNLLSVLGKSRSEVSPELLKAILKYREGQLHNLSQAQFFQVDDNAEKVLGSLINDLSQEGLEDTFQHVTLPFPAMIIERSAQANGYKFFGFLTQIDNVIEAQVHLVNSGGLMPSLICIRTDRFPFSVFQTPTANLLDELKTTENLPEGLLQDRRNALSLLALGVGIATLLEHKGMLEVEEVPAFPRAERRRAEKAGRPLPDIRVSKISLGALGKGQLAAMAHDEELKTKRRAHWVRGHWMRTAGGGLSFRTPHIRGAGPLMRQTRRVTD